MKARLFNKVGLGLVLSALPFVGACTQQTSNTPASVLTAAQAETSPAPPAAASNPAAGPAVTEAVPAQPPPVVLPAPNAGNAPLPPNIKPSAALAEVIKLAQSGVNEEVMLAFVGNATSLFKLGSDEIIYLNDLGVANGVITGMMQRDQALKQAWAEGVQAQAATPSAPAPAVEAAAPSYVNPPAPEPQPANVTYNYFYDSLSPYGNWIDVEGYGRCWQPTVVVVNRGWRPYFDGGRWMYSDAGWYWYSDYTWGWAPFHYGRWFNHSRWGWCWNPGYTWAPAWVSWRYNSGYCGWAPLPPAAVYSTGIGFTYYGGNVGVSFGFGLTSDCYSFVPWSGFYGSRPYKYGVPSSHARDIYQNSTVINNYINGNNNTIINGGVPLDQVRRHTGREIQPVALRESPGRAGFHARRERLESDGRTLAVHRPNLPNEPRSVSAVAPRESVRERVLTTGDGAATTPRELGREQTFARPSAEARERAARPDSTPTARAVLPEATERRSSAPSTPAASGNPRPGGSPLRSSLAENTGGARGNVTRPVEANAGQNRESSRPAMAAPLIVRGGDRTATTAPTSQGRAELNSPSGQRTPPNSLIVSGRRDASSGPARGSANDGHSSLARNDNSPRTGPGSATTRSAVAQAPHASTAPRPQSFAANRPAMPATPPAPPATRSYSAPAQSQPSPGRTPSYNTPRSAPMSSVSVSRPAPAPSPEPSISVPRSSPAPGPTFSASRPASAPPTAMASAPSRSGSSELRSSPMAGGPGSSRGRN